MESSASMNYDLDIIATPTVNLIKRYIKAFVEGKLTIDDVVKGLSQLLETHSDLQTRSTIHLILFLHLTHPEVEEILDNKVIFPLTPFHMQSSFQMDDYSELILQLRLHQEFMYMITALNRKNIAKELLHSSLGMFYLHLTKGLQNNWDDIEMYLFALADLSLYEPHKMFYFNMFSDLFHSYVLADKIKKHQKLATSFKLLAYVCMKPEDYIGSSEIAELNMKWCFAPSKKSAFDGMLVFLFIYNQDPPNNDEKDFAFLFEDLVNTLSVEFQATEDEFPLWDDERCHLADMTWKEYVEVCAYFAGLLIQKYEMEIRITAGIKESVFFLFLSKLLHYGKLKPTMKSEENDIKSFERSCNLLREVSITSYEKKPLLLEFLNNPGSMESDIGLEIIETIVPKGDGKVLLELIKKVSAFIKCKIDGNSNEKEVHSRLERLKDAVLGILKSETLMEIRDEVVQMIFKDGVHNFFETKNLVDVLYTFRQTLIRAMSNMTPTELKEFGREMFVAAIQNPISTVMTLVTICIRAKRCAPLHEVKVFLDLSIGTLNSDAHMPPKTTVLEFSIYKLILELEEQDIFWDFLYNGLSILVENMYIHTSTMTSLLKKLITEFAKTNSLENMTRMVNIFRVILKSSLQKNEIQAGELMEHKTFFDKIYSLTSMLNYNRNGITLREFVIKLLQLIEENLDLVSLNADPVYEKFHTALTSFNDGTAYQLCMIYIRFPKVRPYVVERMLRDTDNPKWSTVEAYDDFTRVVIKLVSATCRLEWEALSLFIIKALYPYKPIIKRSGLHYFMSRVVGLAFQSRNIQTSMFLCFYRAYLEVLKVDEEEMFATTYKDQFDVIKLLVSLLGYLYCPVDKKKEEDEELNLDYHLIRKKSRLAQKVMLILYNLIGWIHGKKVTYPKDMKEDVLKALSLIPTLFPGGDNSGSMVTYKKIMKSLRDI